MVCLLFLRTVVNQEVQKEVQEWAVCQRSTGISADLHEDLKVKDALRDALSENNELHCL